MSKNRIWLKPWLSVRLAYFVTLLFLIIGLPLFIRMPPWCDLTLYDVAAMNLLRGGVHYRDVFDTNLPGFVWILTGIRAVCGWSVEVVRIVDLFVVFGIVLLLNQLAKKAGAESYSRAWAIAAATCFYPFTSEFIHTQRDVWMFLPALAAVVFRSNQLSQRSNHRFRDGAIEGALWGLAVWIKPHVVVPAGGVWLVTTYFTSSTLGKKAILADGLGNFLGGLIIGAIGICYLVFSGTWPAFWEVFTFWNVGYAGQMFGELSDRYALQFHYFPPWSYALLIAMPLTCMLLFKARNGSETKSDREELNDVNFAFKKANEVRISQISFAALFLSWMAQAFFFQKQFQYVHLPETLMMMFLFATRRWNLNFILIAWVMLAGLVMSIFAIPESERHIYMGYRQSIRVLFPHPVTQAKTYSLWRECWKFNLKPEDDRKRKNELRRIQKFFPSNDWIELGEVEDWLKGNQIHDRELLCWHDSPHALYRNLGIRPAYRFQHIGQMMGIGPNQELRMWQELDHVQPEIKYVVSDLMRDWQLDKETIGDYRQAGSDLLPPTMPAVYRNAFPYNEPVVFRSGNGKGRYLVHTLTIPIPWPAEFADRR